MRTKVKFYGKYYRPVPWIKDEGCKGCAFATGSMECPNTKEHGQPCDDGNEFEGMILIRHTAEAYAEYIAHKITGDDNDTAD